VVGPVAQYRLNDNGTLQLPTVDDGRRAYGDYDDSIGLGEGLGMPPLGGGGGGGGGGGVQQQKAPPRTGGESGIGGGGGIGGGVTLPQLNSAQTQDANYLAVTRQQQQQEQVGSAIALVTIICVSCTLRTQQVRLAATIYARINAHT
jgi:hypothetical protein